MIQRFMMWCLKRWMAHHSPPKHVMLVNIEDWKNLPPGRVNISTAPTGEQWAVMHLDDFDHLCEVAGLKRTDPVEILRHGTP